MATSTYNILEYRCIVHPDRTDLYVLIDNPVDFLPIGGWRKKSIGPDVPSLPAIGHALETQEILSWERAAPDVDTQWQQDDIKMLREQIDELCRELVSRLTPGAGA